MNTRITFFIIIVLTVCLQDIFAQKTILENDSTVYMEVDKFPVLIVNEKYYEIDKIKEFVSNNIQYPDNEIDCIGKVYITIIIEKNGTVSKKEFLRKLCPGFDENAMKVIDLMKVWKPGIKNGQPVRTELIIPVSFVI